MSDFAEQRRARLASILSDSRLSETERINEAVEFVEEEVRAAFIRGTRSRDRGSYKPEARGGRMFSPRHSREGKSAVQAGVLRRTSRATEDVPAKEHLYWDSDNGYGPAAGREA